MTDHISTPIPDSKNDVSMQDNDHLFGYYETIGKRTVQEDALAWHDLTEDDLISEGGDEVLTPEQIGHRLWTTYQVLNNSYIDQAGTTASTTVYDGKDSLITATLADAASFVVVYDKQGGALGVLRLNSVTHKPTDASEEERVKAAGGVVLWGRVRGGLAVSRAIGDRGYTGVTADAAIDIITIDEIIATLKVEKENIGSMQIITTCDGFTDGAPGNLKSVHEDYLFEKLKAMDKPAFIPQAELSKKLANAAIDDGSRDNVSVAIQTLSRGKAFLMGVYDGHGGVSAATHVAENIGMEFKKQCRLTAEAYAEQEWSVNKNQEVYDRDHVTATRALQQTVDKLSDHPDIQKSAQAVVDAVNQSKSSEAQVVARQTTQLLESKPKERKQLIESYNQKANELKASPNDDLKQIGLTMLGLTVAIVVIGMVILIGTGGLGSAGTLALIGIFGGSAIVSGAAGAYFVGSPISALQEKGAKEQPEDDSGSIHTPTPLLQ